MITVGINGLYIKWGINAGTETYFTNIIRPWYNSGVDGCQFVLYCNSIPPWWNGEKEYFKIVIIRIASNLLCRLFSEQVILPFLSYKKLNVLFSPGYVGSILYSSKQIITIHDGFAWRYPLEIGVIRGIYWKTAIPISARRSLGVIAVSNSTANDVERFCKIKSSKIKVIYEAGNQLVLHELKTDILDQYDLTCKSYFHCVGFFKDIKNPWNILAAFKKYISSTPIAKQKKLVLVGGVYGSKGKAIFEYAGTIPNVIIVGRINDSELAEIYKYSAGLVFPSLYEGFGIPILEAQSFGCPVITSNIASMPEVAGDGAIFVDPNNVDGLANAMSCIADNVSLVEAGFRNVSRFSWDVASKETIKFICDNALE